MPEAPSRDSDELITKGFLRDELAKLRGEIRRDATELARIDGSRRATRRALLAEDSLRGDLRRFERSFTRRMLAMLAAQNVIVTAVFVLS